MKKYIALTALVVAISSAQAKKYVEATTEVSEKAGTTRVLHRERAHHAGETRVLHRPRAHHPYEVSEKKVQREQRKDGAVTQSQERRTKKRPSRSWFKSKSKQVSE